MTDELHALSKKQKDAIRHVYGNRFINSDPNHGHTPFEHIPLKEKFGLSDFDYSRLASMLARRGGIERIPSDDVEHYAAFHASPGLADIVHTIDQRPPFDFISWTRTSFRTHPALATLSVIAGGVVATAAFLASVSAFTGYDLRTLLFERPDSNRLDSSGSSEPSANGE